MGIYIRVRLGGSYVLPNSSDGLVQSLLSSRHDEDVGAFRDKAVVPWPVRYRWFLR